MPPSDSSLTRFNETFAVIQSFFDNVVEPLMSQTYMGAFLLLVIATTVGFFAWKWIARAFS